MLLHEPLARLPAARGSGYGGCTSAPCCRLSFLITRERRYRRQGAKSGHSKLCKAPSPRLPRCEADSLTNPGDPHKDPCLSLSRCQHAGDTFVISQQKHGVCACACVRAFIRRGWWGKRALQTCGATRSVAWKRGFAA